MKNILVPTDFSEPANNALEYAIELASVAQANLILLNVCYTPLIAGELSMAFAYHQELMERNNNRIEALRKSVEAIAEDKFAVGSLTWHGFAAEEIIGCASDIKASLIVMGTKGSTSDSTVLMGRTATEVIRNSTVPVLAVPATAKYHSVRNILFAFDNNAELDARVIEQLKTYAGIFYAKIQVVNIANPIEGPGGHLTMADTHEEPELETVSPELHCPSEGEAGRELEDLISSVHSDWLAMVPEQENFLCRLFQEPSSQTAAFHMNIPLLAIHE